VDVDLDAGLLGFHDGDAEEAQMTAANQQPRSKPPRKVHYPRVTTKKVVKKCMLQALAEVTPEMWATCCDHTDRVIMQHYEKVKGAVAQPPHPVVEFDVGLTSDEDEDV